MFPILVRKCSQISQANQNEIIHTDILQEDHPEMKHHYELK
jgi:hypothetical protein